MGRYKYKLKEEESSFTSKITGIDPETGGISWDIEYTPDYSNTFKTFNKLKNFLKDLSKASNEPFIETLSNNIKLQFNQYRTWLRKNHPEIYKKFQTNEEIEEMSTSSGAGGFSPKHAFKGSKMGPGPKANKDGVRKNYYVSKWKYKLVPKDKNGNYVQKGSGLEVKHY